jgi:hypothetical protein
MNSKSITYADAELYDTIADARQWVEISQGYDLESGKLQKYTIYELTEVSPDSNQKRGYFVKSGSELLIYRNFNEIIECINDEIALEESMYADRVEMFGAEYADATREEIKLYRLADKPSQVITEVIDEELLAA